jgi:hypothetical protein
VEEAEREEALAQVEPNALDRVEFGRVGREDDKGDVRGHDEVAAQVPAGAVDDHDEMRVRRAGSGDLIEEDLHRRGVDGWQHQRDILACRRTDRGEDVGPKIAELLHARRTLAAPPPAVADPALVADPCLIGKPKLDPFARMLRRDGGYLVSKPPFLKASCASGSFFGWKGRAFWREKPSLLSTRLMLDGW